jgi:probable F420-dependent oxidoreductase
MHEESHRPIRFGTGPARQGTDGLIESARRAEKVGYSTFGLSDHFMIPVSPLIALQAVADATNSLRLTTTVLDQDFRHPAVLAKELATLDVLSGGRVEVGIGAGWMRAEYEQSGIRYDRPSVRVERLEEVVTIVKGLFADEPFSFEGKHFTINGLQGSPRPLQRPRPPILIGGGGPNLLGVAARHADIVQITGTNRTGTMYVDASELRPERYAAKVAHVRDIAGDRFREIELGMSLMMLRVTDDRSTAIKSFLAFLRGATRDGGRDIELTEADVIESPSFVIGTVDQVIQKLLDTRERYGFSYFFTIVGSDDESLAPVIEQVAGK